MPSSTTSGITYPLSTDWVKDAAFASKLAEDLRVLAITTDQAFAPSLSGKVNPKPIPLGSDLLTIEGGWHYVRLTEDSGTIFNRPSGVANGPFLVNVVKTEFGHTTITYYGYSGAANGVYENHTGNAAHTGWVGWRQLDGGGTSTAGNTAGLANPLRVQQFMDAMGPISTGNKGAVAIRFDHGLANFDTKIRALLEARNIKYSLAISPRNFNTGENAGVTAAMVDGWALAEVWNHGANQHQDESSLTGLTDQIKTGKAELQAAIPSKTIWGYAVPGTGGTGQGGFDGGATVEDFYETIAGDLILTNHAVSTGAFPNTARRPLDGKVRQGMAHFTIEAQTVARIKTEIDAAVTNKTGNQLMMHPSLLDTAGYITTAQLAEVLDYIVTRRTAGDLVVLSPYELMVASL